MSEEITYIRTPEMDAALDVLYKYLEEIRVDAEEKLAKLSQINVMPEDRYVRSVKEIQLEAEHRSKAILKQVSKLRSFDSIRIKVK